MFRFPLVTVKSRSRTEKSLSDWLLTTGIKLFHCKLIILIRVTVIKDVGRVGVQLVGEMGIHVGLG